ncbi:MAG: tRNA (adenosine(37)-N6)-threonylcarbamoyltransferase complex transferase subunit TsaD [Bacteriovoracaceae bacterium]
MKKKILGIETSCDDTSICILEGDTGEYNENPIVQAHHTYVQDLEFWGGVVPELASRNHMEKLGPLVYQCLNNSNTKASELDAIAVTTKPGLLGPLLTGLCFAKTLCLKHKLPLITVNHLFAHLEAIHLTEVVPYPYVGLLVSGGHSLLCLVSSPTEFKILSSTIDDAAGEAFDKGGKLLGLPYPAGRIIDEISKLGDESSYEFPIGLRGSKDGKLSFSGVKTSLRQYLEKNPHLVQKESVSLEIVPELSQEFKDLCASYQFAIVKALKLKTEEVFQILKEQGHKDLPLVIGGGVACNSRLRAELSKHFNTKLVKPSFCTDNGAMIANYGLRTFESHVAFPDCLWVDARGRFLDKKELNQSLAK